MNSVKIVMAMNKIPIGKRVKNKLNLEIHPPLAIEISPKLGKIARIKLDANY
jgi:hypothetical protein